MAGFNSERHYLITPKHEILEIESPKNNDFEHVSIIGRPTEEEIEILLDIMFDLDGGAEFDVMLEEHPYQSSIAGVYKFNPVALYGGASRLYSRQSAVLYRNGKWFRGLWNEPTEQENSLHVKISRQMELSENPQGLPKAIAHQTVPGDYSVLRQAIRQAMTEIAPEIGQFEHKKSVRILCDWWNRVAPNPMKCAGSFKMYVWDEDLRVFVPLHEEPMRYSASLASLWPSYSIFQEKDCPAILVCFERGRAFNKESDDISNLKNTHTYFADGSEPATISLESEQVDEAYLSFHSLVKISQLL